MIRKNLIEHSTIENFIFVNIKKKTNILFLMKNLTQTNESRVPKKRMR